MEPSENNRDHKKRICKGMSMLETVSYFSFPSLSKGKLSISTIFYSTWVGKKHDEAANNNIMSPHV
jgi:hypothetical protein